MVEIFCTCYQHVQLDVWKALPSSESCWGLGLGVLTWLCSYQQHTIGQHFTHSLQPFYSQFLDKKTGEQRSKVTSKFTQLVKRGREIQTTKSTPNVWLTTCPCLVLVPPGAGWFYSNTFWIMCAASLCFICLEEQSQQLCACRCIFVMTEVTSFLPTIFQVALQA